MPRAEVLLKAGARLIGGRRLVVRLDAEADFERRAGARRDAELREVGGDDGAAADDALREQRLVDGEGRGHAERRRGGRREHDVDRVAGDAAEGLGDVRHRVDGVAREDSGAAADDRPAALERRPREARARLEVVLVERHVERLVADRVAQPVVQRQVMPRLPGVLPVERVAVGEGVDLGGAEALLVDDRQVEVESLQGVDGRGEVGESAGLLAVRKARRLRQRRRRDDVRERDVGAEVEAPAEEGLVVRGNVRGLEPAAELEGVAAARRARGCR